VEENYSHLSSEESAEPLCKSIEATIALLNANWESYIQDIKDPTEESHNCIVCCNSIIKVFNSYNFRKSIEKSLNSVESESNYIDQNIPCVICLSESESLIELLPYSSFLNSFVILRARYETGRPTPESVEHVVKKLFQKTKSFLFYVQALSDEGDYLKSFLPHFRYLRSFSHIPKDKFSKLLVAYHEAITNGIEHGNLDLSSSLKERIDEKGVDAFYLEKVNRLTQTQYKYKHLTVEATLNDSQYTISVQDEGKGYNFENFESKAPEILSYGRGLNLIKRGVDKVEIRRGGSSIKFFLNFNPQFKTDSNSISSY
jgi:hypothetical protein